MAQEKMKAVIQRVECVEIAVGGNIVSKIGVGLLTLLGVEKEDTKESAEKLISKICNLRIFADESGKMNRSLIDIRGEHLLVSQFTLVADCEGGRRPSFTTAEEPARANELYESALAVSRSLGVRTQGGVFQADMKVSLVNDGPVTFVLSA